MRALKETENRDSERRQEILSSVVTVLREENVRASDMESIVAVAGVSELEVQRYFGGFDQLLVEMASQLTESLIAPLNAGLTDRSIRSTLLKFGRGWATAYGDSHLAGLYRITLTEATRHVGLGKEFFARGPGRLVEELAAYFRAGQVAGLIRDGDMRLRADHFMALLRDNLELRDKLEVPSPNSRREHKASAAATRAVDVICNGIAKEVR